MPAGATTLYHATNSKPGKPDSLTVGTSGNCFERCRVVTAMPRSDPSFIERHRSRAVKLTLRSIWPPIRSASEPGAAAIGHVGHLGAGLLLQQLHGEVRLRADAGDADVELARIGLGVGDQFLQVVRPARSWDWPRCTTGDFANRMIGANALSASNGIFLYMKRLFASTPGGANISVWPSGSALATVGAADIAVGAGAVLDHDRLAELLRQLGRKPPRRDVDRAAGRERHHHGDRAASARLARDSERGREGAGKNKRRAAIATTVIDAR